MICFAFLSFSERKIQTPSGFFSKLVVADGYNLANCRYGDGMTFHPYFAIAHRRNGHCTHADVNDYGLIGRPLPESKDSAYFNLLLLGGSVAEQLIAVDPNSPPLERILNENYLSPNGKPFRLYGGAIAAGSRPMQNVIFSLFQHLSDGVIALEGFNEQRNYGKNWRLESPPHLWFEMQHAIGGDALGLVFFGLSRKLQSFFLENSVLTRSYAAVSVFWMMRRGASLYSPQETSDFRPFPDSVGSLADRKNYFLSQYLKYLSNIHAVSKAEGILEAVFFQPSPSQEKVLTERELNLVGDLEYGADYREMVSKMTSAARRAGIPTANLLEVYRDTKADLYVDHVHTNRVGQNLLSEAMAHKLASLWGLKKKH